MLISAICGNKMLQKIRIVSECDSLQCDCGHLAFCKLGGALDPQTTARRYMSILRGYGQMRRIGVLANPAGSACSHTAMVDKGRIYCKAMVKSVYLYDDQHVRMAEDGGTLGLRQ